ncbi:MAG: hypothetical protein JWO03_913 [Bacteroidetes bacterium]|nr:hypothetical protein [Bacteroidota bacterium]
MLYLIAYYYTAESRSGFGDCLMSLTAPIADKESLEIIRAAIAKNFTGETNLIVSIQNIMKLPI